MIYTRKPFPGLGLILIGISLVYISEKVLPEWVPGSQLIGLPLWLGFGLIGWVVYRNFNIWRDSEFEHRRALHPLFMAKEYTDAVAANNRIIQTMDENQMITANAQRIREIVNPTSSGPQRFVHSKDGDLPLKFLGEWVKAGHPWQPNAKLRKLPAQRDFATYHESWYTDDGERFDTRFLVGAWGRYLKLKGYASEHNNELIFDQEELFMIDMGIAKWEALLK